MTFSIPDEHSTSSHETRITRTVLKDMKRGDFRKTLQRDVMEIIGFYIDEERRIQLNKKWKVFRWLFPSDYILKSLILRRFCR